MLCCFYMDYSAPDEAPCTESSQGRLSLRVLASLRLSGDLLTTSPVALLRTLSITGASLNETRPKFSSSIHIQVQRDNFRFRC